MRLAKLFLYFLCLALLSLSFVNCGGSDDTPIVLTSSAPTQYTGYFLDGAVEGLEYNVKSDTQWKLTGSDGSFSYMSGDTVVFKIGNVVLGGANCARIMTPAELVGNNADENNTTVINISRFLQTIDNDSNTNNGIQISTTTRATANGLNLVFDTTPTNFEQQANLSTLLNGKTLVSATVAKVELVNSLKKRFAGSYTGTFSGAAAGTFGVIFSDTGVISGTATEQDGEIYNVAGNISSTGQSSIVVTGTAGSNTIWTGVAVIQSNGIDSIFSGNWTNSSAGATGTFNGTRVSHSN